MGGIMIWKHLLAVKHQVYPHRPVRFGDAVPLKDAAALEANQLREGMELAYS